MFELAKYSHSPRGRNRPSPSPLKGMPRTLPKSQRQYVKNSEAVRTAAKLKGLKAAPFPKFVAPALATLRDRPPSGGNWVHEIKFDGYRLQAHLRDGQTTFYTRRDYDWNAAVQKPAGCLLGAAG
jgi:bifunctional non-homologous end joining protein LigD